MTWRSSGLSRRINSDSRFRSIADSWPTAHPPGPEGLRVPPDSQASKRSGVHGQCARRRRGELHDRPRCEGNSGNCNSESSATFENECPGSGRGVSPDLLRRLLPGVQVRDQIGPKPPCRGHPDLLVRPESIPFLSQSRSSPNIEVSNRIEQKMSLGGSSLAFSGRGAGPTLDLGWSQGSCRACAY
jgi:hypothetical protein